MPTVDRSNPHATTARAADHSPNDIRTLRDLSPQQWKSGAAAWLGWMFDGLDMHLYTLVATPFVAHLLGNLKTDDPLVDQYKSYIQAAFLVGWALGGGFFGRIGDRLGRSRALVLTIMTYAMFTGLSFFAQTWWQLMLFRFLAALGIGGEWAVGASLLSETWPHRWRPWLAAVLQTGVNIGVIIASLAGSLMAGLPDNYVFLVGVAPALLVLWIRRAVPEPEQWHAARLQSGGVVPRVSDLFRGAVKRTTVLTILVCSFSLTAHWAFMFWFSQDVFNHGRDLGWPDKESKALQASALMWVMLMSVIGNFVAAAIARKCGYRNSIALMCLAYCLSMCFTYWLPRDQNSLYWCLGLMGVSQGVFALFTMYMPPLFPVLLRTTGAGFCYNIGRLAAAGGTVCFTLFIRVGDYRQALFYTGLLFLPAAGVALLLPEPPPERAPVAPLE